MPKFKQIETLLGDVRKLTTQYKAGEDPESFSAFRDLIQLLLSVSVLDQTSAVRLTSGPRDKVKSLGGWTGPDAPLLLTDGRYLRLNVNLYLEQTSSGSRVKVKNSSFQYQNDHNGDKWIFRYDYFRQPPEPHPSAHLHVRGALEESCLPDKVSLEDIHFPTQRVPLEAVIRLLIEQFNVPSNESPETWRSVLAESEALFLDIAHRPLSGPDS